MTAHNSQACGQCLGCAEEIAALHQAVARLNQRLVEEQDSTTRLLSDVQKMLIERGWPDVPPWPARTEMEAGDNVYSLYGWCEDRLREIERLRAELEKVRPDAERYRWLRDYEQNEIGVVTGFSCADSGATGVVSTFETSLYGEELDCAVDASMQEAKE